MAPTAAKGRCRRAIELLRRWQAAQSGATAIEFGMVALPFVLLLFGILSVCLYFFTTFTLENAVWQAARAIRTGQVQQSQGDYTAATTNDDRKKLFKKAMCAKAPSFFNCLGKAVVIVQSNANFGSIVEPKCATNGVMAEEATAAFDPGNASSVVLVTVCYPWDFGGKLPFIRLGNLQNGALLMQASVTFRTEPYN
ncbi:MAG TPA: TadE/TadG family type IV pilus assembly protein [Hyphomicrobiaceae bacterium]|jgi:Flp pilus assembly protein TadG|nr:TadE/TadG family type IV pilus assembly protein [Hyphomicrobiaceae bacterium]